MINLRKTIENILFPPKKTISDKTKSDIKKQWQKVEEKMKKGGESNFKIAVIEADKIFGKTLRLLGYDEKTWAKSMAQAKERFKKQTENGIWQAHKLRNRLVHDDHQLHSYEAKSAVKKFKRGLKELNIL